MGICLVLLIEDMARLLGSSTDPIILLVSLSELEEASSHGDPIE